MDNNEHGLSRNIEKPEWIAHMWQVAIMLVKIAPLFFGFLIFLIYFCQNNFFPSFDLFSLASLLVAALVIGLMTFFVLVLGLAAPGFIWVGLFLRENDAADYFSSRIRAKQEISPIGSIARLAGMYFLLPLLILNAATVLIFYGSVYFAAVKWSYLVVLAVLLCIFTILMKRRYETPHVISVGYTIYTLMAILLGNVVSLFVVAAIIKGLAAEQSEPVQIFVGLSMMLVMPLVFFIIAMAGYEARKNWLILSSLSALLFALMSGAMGTMPGVITRVLGTGNYIAIGLVFDEPTCERLKAIEQDVLGNDCVWRDVKVIWSLGDVHRLEYGSEEHGFRAINVPSDAVIATVTQRIKAQRNENN